MKAKLVLELHSNTPVETVSFLALLRLHLHFYFHSEIEENWLK